MEVRTNEGPSSEAVISKLTDASLYTVGESLPADWSARAPSLIGSSWLFTVWEDDFGLSGGGRIFVTILVKESGRGTWSESHDPLRQVTR